MEIIQITKEEFDNFAENYEIKNFAKFKKILI